MPDVRILPWREAVQTLAQSWPRLVAAQRLNPTLDPSWMGVVLAAHSRLDVAQVATLMESGELAGVLPFTCAVERAFGYPLRTVDVCSNLMSYHAELVVTRNADKLLTGALHAAYGGKWDLFRLRNVVDDGHTAGMLTEYASTANLTLIAHATESSPYLPIDRDWTQFLKTRPTKFRSNMSRAARRFTPERPARMTWHEDGARLDTLIDNILAVEEASWKRPAGHAISRRAHEERYYRLLLPVLAARNALMANVLHVEDRPAAYVLCCLWDGWAGQLKTSFDARIDDAGTHVISASVERAFQRGAREYDFLGDATAHKLKWTASVRSHRDYWLYSGTIPARAIGLIKKWRVRKRKPREL